jgi:hypothetical protein
MSNLLASITTTLVTSRILNTREMTVLQEEIRTLDREAAFWYAYLLSLADEEFLGAFERSDGIEIAFDSHRVEKTGHFRRLHDAVFGF